MKSPAHPLPALLLALFLIGSSSLATEDYEGTPFHYWTAPPRDPVSRLQADLRSGAFRLPHESGPEALRALLDYFGISPASQVLVFSKTSAQNARISPAHPRAIYFSDDLYLGWVQDGGMEILSFDPHLGALCYYVDLPHHAPGEEAFITRPAFCMDCHVQPSTGGVPGGLVRSVFPGPDGLPFFQAGGHRVDHSTPLAHRWGGWYVTGSAGNQIHQGNSLAEETAGGDVILRSMSQPSGAPLSQLDSLIDAHPYPGGSQSDILALMVLEHQIQLHNLLNSANFLIRKLHYQSSQIRASQGEPPLTAPEGSLAKALHSQARRIVEALLFKDEFAMEQDGIQGAAAYEEAFIRNRLCGRDGRSLKDLRLHERLFKHRCSYTIYSQPFAALTPWLKTEVYRQLLQSLEQPGGTTSSAHLGAKERQRILQILLDTIPELSQPPHALRVDS